MKESKLAKSVKTAMVTCLVAEGRSKEASKFVLSTYDIDSYLLETFMNQIRISVSEVSKAVNN